MSWSTSDPRGYPVPAVEEVSDDGFDMVIERIEGIDMVATMTKRPWTIPGKEGYWPISIVSFMS